MLYAKFYYKVICKSIHKVLSICGDTNHGIKLLGLPESSAKVLTMYFDSGSGYFQSAGSGFVNSFDRSLQAPGSEGAQSSGPFYHDT